ncbi:hypothetical protein HCJ76_44065 [Streptomyces sp. MC1]|uniref:hypothetical protein n=1 Tax=Streptomyces sp. MC1 TaxID=295105 RepID=UPI0018C9224C|nr:hypothetical protein [Streptomyces sp. MC1]MBG7704860.1 hypothetical protein [Streptomyces sp. MC1]
MSTTMPDRLLAYWQMADEHKASLDEYRDLYGEPDDDQLQAFNEARATAAIEDSEFLQAVMDELAELYPLPPGRMVTVPGANGATYTVTTGELNPAAIKAFASGQCHALARALSRVTGWPMAVLISDECVYDGDQCTYADDAYSGLCSCRFQHVVVERPDGALVDIRGAFHPGHVPGYEGQEAVELDEEGWAYLSRSPQWRRPAVATARTFTAPLLAAISDSVL